jgi:hypothetical protein
MKARDHSKRSPGTRPVVLFLARSLFLLVSGCGLFSIRNPNAPEQGLVEHIPNDPDSVLLNFALGVEAGQEGSFAIERALADTFLLKLDPIYAQEIYSNPDISLNKEETVRGWNSFVSDLTQGVGVRLDMKTEEARRENIDSKTVLFDEMPYFLIRFVNGEVRDTLASGAADLYLQESESRWYMSRWIDKITGNRASFGEIVEPGSGHPH